MPITLCGKCGKAEPGCDCRPLAIPDSGNVNASFAHLVDELWRRSGMPERTQGEDLHERDLQRLKDLSA